MKVALWICLVLSIGLAGWLYPSLYPSLFTTQRVARPVVGDQVQPEISISGIWQAGQLGRATFRLEASGSETTDFLTDMEVPTDYLPRIELRFFNGTEEIVDPVPCKVERAC